MPDPRSHLDFCTRYGPWALVAGAAEGLGAATAAALAQRGLHLWLIDHQAEPLLATAERIRTAENVSVYTQTLDLSRADAVDRIAEAVGDRPVGLVACVAASIPIGRFTDHPIARHDQTVDVNCRTPMRLVHHFCPAMLARGRGGVLLFSSLAGFQGSSYLGTYAATKAFLQVFAESLAAEFGPGGVDVAATCPGPTSTPAFVRSSPATRPGPVMSPQAVVEATLREFGRRAVIVPGRFNRLTRAIFGLIGRRRAVAMISRATARMYPSRGPSE